MIWIKVASALYSYPYGQEIFLKQALAIVINFPLVRHYYLFIVCRKDASPHCPKTPFQRGLTRRHAIYLIINLVNLVKKCLRARGQTDFHWGPFSLAGYVRGRD